MPQGRLDRSWPACSPTASGPQPEFPTLPSTTLSNSNRSFLHARSNDALQNAQNPLAALSSKSFIIPERGRLSCAVGGLLCPFCRKRASNRPSCWADRPHRPHPCHGGATSLPQSLSEG